MGAPHPPAAARERHAARLLIALTAVTVLTATTAASCGDDARPCAGVGRPQPGHRGDRRAGHGNRPCRRHPHRSADGTLASLRVQPGQRVKRGQVLAVVDSPTAQQRLRQAKDALTAAKRAGRGVSTGSLAGSRRGTDRAADEAFDAARKAAEKIADPQLRDALLTQVTSAQRQYSAAARSRPGRPRGPAGISGLNSAVGALSAAQRLQAQQAYDLAKATVDALTLRAPIAGVVQPGGTRAGGDATGGLAGCWSRPVAPASTRRC
ncbi:biotin/lipoyl-binding protein [Micromonospora sp. M12]